MTLKEVAFLCANLGNRLRRDQQFDRLQAGNLLLQAALAADAAAEKIKNGNSSVTDFVKERRS